MVLAPGTHTLSVTFTPADAANYSTAHATVPFIVVAKETPVIAWSNPEPIAYGTPLSSKQLCANASVPGTFDYSARPGEVLAAGMHSLSVTFTPTDGVSYTNAQTTVSLKVAKAMPTLLWPAPTPILEGTPLDAVQLCATSPLPGRFDYSPFPGAALPPGNHPLSVVFTPADRANYAAAEATVPLTVLAKAMPAVAWPNPSPISYGTILSSAQLCATASVQGTFDYSPAAGLALTAGTHTLSVTFTPSDTDNYASVETAVSLLVERASPVVAWSDPDPVSYGAKLSAQQLGATASVPGRFDYSPASGAVLAAGTHTLAATFTPADSANYTAVRATVSVEVARATPEIEWPAPQSIRCDIALGDAQLCARSQVPGTFEYTPGLGQVLPVGTHTLSVIFTPADAANYISTQASVSINVVLKPTPVITWPNPDPISYGTPLDGRQLCAMASVPGRLQLSAARGEVLAAGTHTLSVTFSPEDSANYATTQATALVKVDKVTPSIDWPTPQSIKPGTPLSAVQLAAAAWVPGTFIYSPAADEVLTLGTHTLSAKFIPTDSVNYHPAQAAVTLKVAARAVPVLSWSNPDPIVHGTALGPAHLCAKASVPGIFNYSPARGEVLPPGAHTLSVTFLPSDAEEYLPAQAMADLRVEAVPDPPRRPAPFEEVPEPLEKPAVASHVPEATYTAEEAPWTPPWRNVPEEVLPQPTQSNLEVEKTEKKARKRWVVAVTDACVILLLIALGVSLFHLAMKFRAQNTVVAPVPVATETPSKPIEPKRPHRTRVAQSQPVATAEAATPTSAQAEMMNDQLAAPARIPENTQPQVPAEAPPPVNISAVEPTTLDGSGTIGNVFVDKAPRIVAAPPPGPLTIPTGVAMGFLIQRTLPVYPPIARQARVSGTVQLEAVISKAGAVETLKVVNGPGMLRQAALDAVRTWRFRPYMVNSEAREIKTAITVNFALD